MASPLLPTIIIFSVLFSISASLHGSFTVELLHRDSPKSPYHNPTATSFDRLHAASHRTFSRVSHFRRSLISTNGSFQSVVILDPSDSEYLMSLSLGTPPTKFLFIADTGSDTIWTQCKGCDTCFMLHDPLFDPEKSSTYQYVPCDSKDCIDEQCCTNTVTCSYDLLYGDSSYTSGVLSYETFSFESTKSNSLLSFPKMVFGCSSSIGGNFGSKASGIVGLGNGPSSLITQLNSTIAGKFSYCLTPYTNLSASSMLSFGKGAVVGGSGTVSTPLVPGDRRGPTLYWVTLEEIFISDGEHRIKINRGDDGISPVEGNMVVDSGTTLTLLDESTIEELESRLSSLIKLPRVKLDGLFRLCYNATRMSPSDLPEMTFMFTGARVKLNPINTFVEADEGVMCLAMLPTGGIGVPIYGNVAQQNFHVGFDLEAKMLSFTPADCANL